MCFCRFETEIERAMEISGSGSGSGSLSTVISGAEGAGWGEQRELERGGNDGDGSRVEGLGWRDGGTGGWRVGGGGERVASVLGKDVVGVEILSSSPFSCWDEGGERGLVRWMISHSGSLSSTNGGGLKRIKIVLSSTKESASDPTDDKIETSDSVLA